MVKLKIYLLASFIFYYTVHNIAEAQSYSIKSFEGSNAKINLNYKLFSKTLSVSCLNDTLFLNDYTGTTEVHVLNERFLQIIYDVRGGSGLDLRNTLILSVNKNNINVSMLVASYVGVTSMYQQGLYKLKLNMLGDSKSNYKLIIDIHDEQKFKRNPQTNYTHNSKVTLSFDASQNIFYSTHERIAKYFSTFDDNTGKAKKQYISGTFPVINLGKIHYYFIKGEWYGTSFKDNLVQYAYKSSTKGKG
jgi:hypothetical protein